MSKIITALLAATGATKQGRREDPQDFFERVMVATSKLTDDEFDDLNEDTQEWCNEASIFINKRKDVPEPDGFGDAGGDDEKPAGRRGRRRNTEKEEKPATTRRGRRSAKDEEPEKEEKTTGRGRGRGRGRAAEKEEKPATTRRGGRGRGRKADEPTGPVVGEEIAFADIKEFMILSNVDGELEGEVTKVVARSFMLATEDGEEKITKTQAKGSILEELPKEEEDPKKEKEEKPAGRRGRSTTAGGSKRSGRGRGSEKAADDSSAVAAIREILVDDPDCSMEEVGDALEDDGVECKPATLKLTYNTFRDIYELLERKGVLAD